MHLITSEFPPQPGGVSDYTLGVATALAAEGEEVHVWCPASSGLIPEVKGVTIHRGLGRFRVIDLHRVGQELDQFPSPRRLLVQWVPHGYGYKSMNVMFCWWLWKRASSHGDTIEIMVHEPYLVFRAGSIRQSAAALVHRLMTTILLRAARKVWVSIPEWERRWRPYALGRQVSFEWLPIPSNILPSDNPIDATAVRSRYICQGGTLIGHFGTFGAAVASVLLPILGLLDGASKNYTVLLMGIGSERFRDDVIRSRPSLASLIRATGPLSAIELSAHVAACDLLIQPFPDGVSTRRTSFMIGLSHGKPVVTTSGPLSESFWKETNALALAPVNDSQRFVDLVTALSSDAAARDRMGLAARALYGQRFDIRHTVAALQRTLKTCGS